jgi:type I restriction enzyme, S subunit
MKGGIYPVYGGNRIAGMHNEFNLSGDNVIIGRVGALCGNARHIKEQIWQTDNAFKVVDFKYEFDNAFLTYILNYKELRKLARQAAQPVISNSSLKDLELNFPVSVIEQKRIVTILDETFAVISQAVANAEKNLTNTRELFDSCLNNVFKQKGEGWEDKLLSLVCTVDRGSSPRPIKSYLTDDADGVNWIKIGDTKCVSKLIYSTKQKITKDGAKRSRRVNEGDFILTNSMSYGKPYIMATSGCIHDGWFALRLNKDIDTDYFYYLLTSRLVQDQFHMLAAGAVVKNISGDLVKKTLLPIPLIAKQKQLVQYFEILDKKTKRLESIYKQKITSLIELKQSILQKAFSGELTTDLPEQVNV